MPIRQTVCLLTETQTVHRFCEEGVAGLQDRTSRPARSPLATVVATIEHLIERRQQRQTYRRIARALGIGQSTVARILKRKGLNRLADMSPARPDNRYGHEASGALLHLDTKKLGRFERPGHRVTGDRQQNTPNAGWEYVHVAIDDHSRLAFSSRYPDETGWSACLALLRIVRYYASLGGRFTRVLTDNGACYRSRRFQRLCRRLRLKHRGTRPYSPRTNGKTERFIQTALQEWAYARSYASSEKRGRHLPAWLHQYNWHRPHASLDYHPPVSRLGFYLNNPEALHS